MTQHLIHVGYPKAGSTFLQQWFTKHPAFRYVEGGLSGFRNVHEMCRLGRPDQRYCVTSCEELSIPADSAGRARAYTSGQTSISAAPIKEKQAQVCALLRDLSPGSRILIVTRGFKGMIRSSYSQYVRGGGTMDPAGMCASLGEAFVRDEHFFDYDYLIGLYVEAFGADNVIVLPYELLRDDQARFLAILEAQLDLDHVDIEMQPANVSLPATALYWYPLLSRLLLAPVSRLAPARRDQIVEWYVVRGAYRGLAPLVGLLGRVKPERAISDADFRWDILRHCERKATRIERLPAYAPYAAEYLLD